MISLKTKGENKYKNINIKLELLAVIIKDVLILTE